MAKNVLADLVLRLSANSAELSKGIANANKSLGSLEKGVKNVGGQVVGAMAKMGGAFFAIGGAVDFFKGAMNSTGKTADAFAATIEGIKQGFDAVKRAVATLDFKDFIKNVKSAIDEGRRYAENLDDLDEKTRRLKIAEADATAKILEQTKIQRSAKSTNDEKIAAGKEIIRLEEELAGIRTGIAQQAYDNEITNIASITKLTNKEVEAYLRGEKAIVDNIAAGETYNDALKERSTILKTVANAGGWTKEQTARFSELTKITQGATEETKRFAFAAKAMADDPKLNLAVEKYVELQGAKNSATEKTLRTSLRLDSVEEKIADGIEKAGEKAAEAALRTDKYTTSLGKLSAMLVAMPLADKQEMLAGIKGVIPKIPAMPSLSKTTFGANAPGIIAPTQNTQENIDKIIETNKQIEAGIIVAEEYESAWTTSLNNINKGLTTASMAFTAFSDLQTSLMNRELVAAGNNESKKEEIRKKYAKKQKAGAIAQAVINGALAVTNMMANVPLSALNPLTWVGIGVAAAATAAQVALIASQPLAKGGLAYGSTLATVGEYPGARFNPEVIAPLSDLRDLLGSATLGGEVRFVIEQNQLVGILDKYNKKNIYF